MRHKVIEVRQEVFNHNEHEVSKRWAFEEGVGVLFDSTTMLIVENIEVFFGFYSLAQ